MVQAINAAPALGVSASWFSLADAAHIDRFIDQADALVLCRARSGPIVDRVLARASLRRIPVLFDVDDLVFDQSYVPLILDALDQDTNSERVWDYWFAYTGRLAATLRNCNGAITTNEYLASKIFEFFPGMTARVVPNFFNRTQQEMSIDIWHAKSRSRFKRDDKLHIGYFSGTRTHNHDFEVAASALAKIMDDVPSAILRVVGFLDLNNSLARHSARIEAFPLQDFLNLQRLIGEVEINLVPLHNSVFTNCKSELKYFEAAIVGTLTIASPTFAFRNAIHDGQNGFLSSAHEWESKLHAAVETVADQDEYHAIAERAHKHANNTYSWHSFANQILSAVFGDNEAAGPARPETNSMFQTGGAD